MTRSGVVGDPLPHSARGHCGFIDRWSINMCWAPADTHLLIDHPGGSAMFVCRNHDQAATKVIKPVDRHAVSDDCIHPKAKWQLTDASGVGFCHLPSEDVELFLESILEVKSG